MFFCYVKGVNIFLYFWFHCKESFGVNEVLTTSGEGWIKGGWDREERWRNGHQTLERHNASLPPRASGFLRRMFLHVFFFQGKIWKVRVSKDESVNRESEESIGEAEEVFRSGNEHEPYASLPRVLTVHSKLFFTPFFFFFTSRPRWKRKPGSSKASSYEGNLHGT